MKTVGIIGGGVSGLTAAITVSRQGYKPILFEKNKRVGKKLLVTGNGLCNFTNSTINKENYYTNYNFISSVFDKFGQKQLIDFLASLGIEYFIDDSGRYFPSSKQASSILNVLLREMERLKVEVKTETFIVDIKKNKNGFILIDSRDRNYKFSKIIISSGSKSYPQLGSDDSILNVLKKLGHNIVTPICILAPIKLKKALHKTASGAKIYASVSIKNKKRVIKEKRGEIVFTNYGISGMPVIDLSFYASKLIQNREKAYIVLDFLPNVNASETVNKIKKRKNLLRYGQMKDFFVGWFNNRIGDVFLKYAGIENSKKISDMSVNDIKMLEQAIHNMRFEIEAVLGAKNSFASIGGVDTKEINPHNMESKLIKNIYFAGEVVDVAGECGGYNIQWAFSSGFLSGMLL